MALEGAIRGVKKNQLPDDIKADFDYIIGMDAWNIRNIMRIIGSDPEKKVSMLLDFSDRPGTEIADPWYTGNFDATYDDVLEGCTGLLEHLKNTEAFLNL